MATSIYPEIRIEADRREVLRLEIDPKSLRLEEDGEGPPRVVAFDGVVREEGVLVSQATPLGALLDARLLHGMRDGHISAVRLYCGPGQVLPLVREANALMALRAGQPVSLEESSLLGLMMPDQHRHLARCVR